MKNFRKTIIDEFAKSTQREKFAKIVRKQIIKNEKSKNVANERSKNVAISKNRLTKKRDERFENVANLKNKSKKSRFQKDSKLTTRFKHEEQNAHKQKRKFSVYQKS